MGRGRRPRRLAGRGGMMGSALSPHRRAPDTGFFERRIAPAAFAAFLLAALLFALGSAFGEGGGSGRDGREHGLSVGATGYAGIIDVGRRAGLDIAVDRRIAADTPRGLTVITLGAFDDINEDDSDLAERVKRLRGPVLVVLGKHWTEPASDQRRGFVRRSAGRRDMPRGVALRTVAADARLDLAPIGVADTVPLPRQVQSWSAANATPVLSVDGHALLVRKPVGGRDVLILSEPDLISNLALGDADSTRGGLALLFALSKGDAVRFDVALNGLASDARSLLQRALAPPWLGLTLAGLTALVALLWAGFQRTAPPRIAPVPFAQGKAALIASGARLVSKTGRWRMLAPRYTGWVRESVARARHAPPGLDPAALDQWLDRFSDARGQRFSDLATRLDHARRPVEMIDAASDLARWRQEIIA